MLRKHSNAKLYSSLSVEQAHILIPGDLNCNLLKVCPEGSTLENFMFEMNLKQFITTPTRITDINESLHDRLHLSTVFIKVELWILLKFINNSWVIKPIVCKHSVTRCCLDTEVKHRQTAPQEFSCIYVIKIFDYIVFSCLDIPVKHSLSLFIYYIHKRPFTSIHCAEDEAHKASTSISTNKKLQKLRRRKFRCQTCIQIGWTRFYFLWSKC
jgi:hypothetical protein